MSGEYGKLAFGVKSEGTQHTVHQNIDAEDTGVKIIYLDRTTGIVRSVAGPTEAANSSTMEASGKIRMEFSSKGLKGIDSEVNERLTRFSKTRMGRP